MAKRKTYTTSEMRSLRAQQIIFGLIGLIVILSMVISLVAK